MGEDAARMVEVGAKEITEREAVAECTIRMTREACERLVAGTPKGNPLEAARIAGLMGIKRTPELLPFCHPISITGADVAVDPNEVAGTIGVRVTVRAADRTGVEMEALTGAAVAALSLYDTAKAYDRAADIGDLRLVSKRGGTSGAVAGATFVGSGCRPGGRPPARRRRACGGRGREVRRRLRDRGNARRLSRSGAALPRGRRERARADLCRHPSRGGPGSVGASTRHRGCEAVCAEVNQQGCRATNRSAFAPRIIGSGCFTLDCVGNRAVTSQQLKSAM